MESKVHREIIKDKKEKVKYDRALLDKVLERDGATLVGNSEAYEKLNSDLKINYKCLCGNITSKVFRSIYKLPGAICNDCYSKGKTNPDDTYQIELICKRYNITITNENIKKVRKSIQHRIYNFKHRDIKKYKRFITFENAKSDEFDEYKINTVFFNIDSQDKELKELSYLCDKTVSNLNEKEMNDILMYINNKNRPILLYKKAKDSLLLVTKLPDFSNYYSYNELITFINEISNECSYCKCQMTLLNNDYCNTSLTFDAIIPYYGHTKQNIQLCCSLCNSKKTFNNTLEL